MRVIGLTGGVGCGKSAAAKMFDSLGACVIDTDAIAHQLTAVGQPLLTKLREQFGAGCFQPDGGLDRAHMRRLIFSDPTAKQKLEGMLHPLIHKEVGRLLQTVTAPYAIVVVPLLLETGAYQQMIGRILVVDCDPEQQVARVMARNGMNADEVRAIMAHQVDREKRLQAADDVLLNQGNLDDLRQQVEVLHHRYLAPTETG